MTKSEILLTSGKTIYSLQDLSVLWSESDRRKLVEIVKYYVRKGKLLPIKRGIYSIKKEYSDLELAQKLIPQSYISFHTALSIHGINFQYYNEIHCCSLQSRRILINDKVFVYHKIPENVFFNSLGLDQENYYTIANPERSICDSLLLAVNLSFDHLDNINFNKLLEISNIYNNQRLVKRIQKLTKLTNK